MPGGRHQEWEVETTEVLTVEVLTVEVLTAEVLTPEGLISEIAELLHITVQEIVLRMDQHSSLDRELTEDNLEVVLRHHLLGDKLQLLLVSRMVRFFPP